MSDVFSLEQIQEKYPRHNIQSKLDSGGQKVVYRGTFDGDDIVLKTIIANSWEATKRAELEIRAMKKIDSPVMVDLYQSFQDVIDDHEVFVMVEEFIPGGTLLENIQKDGPSIALGINVGRSILPVLREFQDRDYVHRDIKPHNIIVDPEGNVRLLDVGIVRSIGEADTEITPTDRPAAPGTPGFRAPEQIDNDKERQDIRTDLFALGITMFFSMTGIHPFDVADRDVKEAIRDGGHNDLTAVLGVDEDEGIRELQWWLDRVMTPTMHRRLRTPKIALDELNRINNLLS